MSPRREQPPPNRSDMLDKLTHLVCECDVRYARGRQPKSYTPSCSEYLRRRSRIKSVSDPRSCMDAKSYRLYGPTLSIRRGTTRGKPCEDQGKRKSKHMKRFGYQVGSPRREGVIQTGALNAACIASSAEYGPRCPTVTSCCHEELPLC